MDELSAAVGLAQLERLPALREARSRVAKAYLEALAGHPLIRTPEAALGTEVDWFVYVVRLDASVDRDAVMSALQADGIASRAYFSPLHLQPLYTERFGYRVGDFPVTERVAASTLALPWSTKLSDGDVARVASSLVRAAERHRVHA
jgi:perosamine synthetase